MGGQVYFSASQNPFLLYYNGINKADDRVPVFCSGSAEVGVVLVGGAVNNQILNQYWQRNADGRPETAAPDTVIVRKWILQWTAEKDLRAQQGPVGGDSSGSKRPIKVCENYRRKGAVHLRPKLKNC